MKIMRPIDLYSGATPSSWRTRTIAAPVIVFVSFLCGGLIGAGTIEGLTAISLYPKARWATTMLATSFVFGASILALWLWLRFFERKSLASLGLSSADAGKAIRGYALGLGFVGALVGTLWLVGGCQVNGPGALFHPAPAALIPAIITVVSFLIQGSFEEIAIRGWMMQIISSRYGLMLAVIGSTILFTMAHAVNVPRSPELVLGLINVFCAGLFLALYAITERSLWGPCAWHGAWNWALGVGFGLDVSGAGTGVPPLFAGMEIVQPAPWWLTGASFGPEASIVTSGILLVGISYWIAKYRSNNVVLVSKV